MDAQQYQELMQRQQIDQLKRELMGKILAKEAMERLGRVRVVNPQLAEQVETYLLTIYQQGKLSQLITDGKLRDILQLVGQKQDVRITRK